jgi:uncharacterized membrane protein YjgN (DUF898 family)
MESPPAAEARYGVEFTATTGEYFRIWIVNLALTIVTLGIYSAWAKVRKRRYFYAHTRIGGESFEYRGNPMAILKGRLIAAALLAAFVVCANFLPDGATRILLFVLGVSVGPWLLVRSFRFNARNTVYRNIRLQFSGAYGSCFKVVIKYIWFIFFGILYPYFKHQLVKYTAENHAYGTTRFEVADFKKPFIHAYAVAYGLGLLGMLAGVALFALTTAGAGPRAGLLAVFYLMFFLLFAFIRARTTNAVWNAIRVGPARFECTLSGLEFMWLYASNLAAIVLTLGLATPWAVVRTLRYRAARFALLASAPLDGFIQAEAGAAGAAGEEIAEAFDLDIAL